MRTWVLLVACAARLRRVTPTVPDIAKPEVALPKVPFPSTLLDKLRVELSTTDKTMKDAENKVAHLKGSNKILQNLVITAFRQMHDLREVMDRITPELENCVDDTMPDRFNVSAFNSTAELHVFLANNSNTSAQALRAEMHLLRVYDEQLHQYRRELEACRLCEPATLVIALQAQVRNGTGDEPAAVLPRLIDELEELNGVFQGFTSGATAAGASEQVLEGMSAEAMKALFALQHEVDTLEAHVYECTNATAPFEIHVELGEHLQAFPKVSSAMIHRAQAESDKRAIEVSDIAAELTECHVGCPASAPAEPAELSALR